MKYPVLIPPLSHNNRLVAVGDLVELTPAQAAPLIEIGVLGEAEVEATLVNLNTASNEELQALPHVARGLAARIEKARPITTLEGMDTLLGLSAEHWAEVAALVTL